MFSYREANMTACHPGVFAALVFIEPGNLLLNETDLWDESHTLKEEDLNVYGYDSTQIPLPTSEKEVGSLEARYPVSRL